MYHRGGTIKIKVPRSTVAFPRLVVVKLLFVLCLVMEDWHCYIHTEVQNERSVFIEPETHSYQYLFIIIVIQVLLSCQDDETSKVF